MGYSVKLIDQETCDDYKMRCCSNILFSAKADIAGVCVELCTSDREHIEMWNDNFYVMSDHTIPHARLFCINDLECDVEVFFEPITCTAFLFNIDYYGWIKSIALGITGSILEEAHDRFSIHGATLNVDDIGVTLIAPSKTGKTTQSWGLLRDVNSSLISDDWYFVKLGKGRPIAYGSEKNCYIDADIGDVWEEFKPLVKNVRFDNNGRGIANIRWIAGNDSVSNCTTIRHVILMKRDPTDPCRSIAISSEEALHYMLINDLCNPHQIIRSERKMRIRTEFLRKFLDDCDVHMVNTIGTPEQTQDIIRNIIRRCNP
jgi:hypothetical protein